LRAAYAHDDPWKGLPVLERDPGDLRSDGGDLIFLNLQLFRGMNLWHLGVFAAAERAL